jgi:hypothetical protein
MNREQAQLVVEKFNRSELTAVGKSVFYLKSQIEGKVKTSIQKAAYIQGDNKPVCELSGMGIALLDKIEPTRE